MADVDVVNLAIFVYRSVHLWRPRTKHFPGTIAMNHDPRQMKSCLILMLPLIRNPLYAFQLENRFEMAHLWFWRTQLHAWERNSRDPDTWIKRKERKRGPRRASIRSWARVRPSSCPCLRSFLWSLPPSKGRIYVLLYYCRLYYIYYSIL